MNQIVLLEKKLIAPILLFQLAKASEKSREASITQTRIEKSKRPFTQKAKIIDAPQHRGQPNRSYKKPNPNPNISSMIFGSYNRIRIVQKGIRFLINRIPNIGFLCSVYKKPNS